LDEEKTNRNPQNSTDSDKKMVYESRHIYSETAKSKADIEFEEKRVKRAFGHVWNVIWSLMLIIFFNFFSKYIAYYQYEKIDGSLNWNVYPIITSDFSKLVPLITAGLSVILIGNIILLIFDRYVLLKIIEIVSAIFSVAVLANIMLVFPFDFNIIPYDKLSQILPIILNIILGLIIFILAIMIITNFVKIVVKIAKR